MSHSASFRHDRTRDLSVPTRLPAPRRPAISGRSAKSRPAGVGVPSNRKESSKTQRCRCCVSRRSRSSPLRKGASESLVLNFLGFLVACKAKYSCAVTQVNGPLPSLALLALSSNSRSTGPASPYQGSSLSAGGAAVVTSRWKNSRSLAEGSTFVNKPLKELGWRLVRTQQRRQDPRLVESQCTQNALQPW